MKAGSVCVCVLLTDPLVVLLLLDLLHLVQQLSHSQLQLSQLVLGCDFRVVVGVFSHLNVQMDPLEGEDKPGVSEGTSRRLTEAASKSGFTSTAAGRRSPSLCSSEDILLCQTLF